MENVNSTDCQKSDGSRFMSKNFVTGKELMEGLALKCLTPEINLNKVYIPQKSINRPAFQLAGYYEFFDQERVQILGLAETEYVSHLTDEQRLERFDKLFSMGFPAAILSRGITPRQDIINAANRYNIPLFVSDRDTGKLIVDVVSFLNEQMAEMETRHGVLVDVFGEGILITGTTGIGKSETAIELIKRGHRLVADDLVEIRKTPDMHLLGKAPEITRHFVELRGIGVVDVKSLYGVECVKSSQRINMNVHLEQWDGSTYYDRLGLEEEYEDIMGVKIVKHTVPVRPGRNLAVVIETAAVNNRQKKMGYNAAQEMVDRVRREIRRKNSEEEN